MEWLQSLIDNSSTPVVTAFLLGLLTAVSPCPLATNITAIGYIGKNIESRRVVFLNGILYTLGRVVAYTILGIILISILRQGASMFGVQKMVSKWGELILGPVMILISLFMLFGDRLNLPKFGFSGDAERFAGKGSWGALILGILFAMAFCPTSGILYFGMLIPLSVSATAGWLLPLVFAIATALPVLIVAWILAFSIGRISNFYGKMQTAGKWLNITVAIVFLTIGIYYTVLIF
ncbi:MAG: aromatic aminobenezylarsenical efflux permease ArsG family transporter [Lepagella sp.]